jgi:putative protease
MKSVTLYDAESGEKKGIFTGLLVRNLEQLGYLENVHFSGKVVLDYGVYVWNKEALLEFLDCNRPDSGFMIGEMTIPYELSFGEAKELLKSVKATVDIPISYNIYGRLPMMISAGCVKKTTGKCSGKLHELYSETMSIVDRMNNALPVTTNCRSCYNVIWNAHPTSLHKKLDKITGESRIDSLRVDFTTESPKETVKVLRYYIDRMNGRDTLDIFAEKSYTGAHFSRGVE